MTQHIEETKYNLHKSYLHSLAISCHPTSILSCFLLAVKKKLEIPTYYITILYILLNIELTTHHHKLAVISISIQLVETYFLRLLDILFVEVRRVCSYVQRGPSGADSCLEYKMVELRKRGSQS